MDDLILKSEFANEFKNYESFKEKLSELKKDGYKIETLLKGAIEVNPVHTKYVKSYIRNTNFVNGVVGIVGLLEEIEKLLLH